MANCTVGPESFSKIALSQSKYRRRVDIVVDILETVMRVHPRGKTKTQIMQGANLSYEQVNRYLDILLQHDFIRSVKTRYGDRDLVSYSFTPLGFELIRQLHTLRLVQARAIAQFTHQRHQYNEMEIFIL